MAIYSGTLAHHRLADEDCVTGGLLGLGYEIRDPVVSRFRALLVQLRLQAIRRYGINVFAHDIGLNIALARHFELSSYSQSLEQEYEAVFGAINSVRLRGWHSALALAQADLNLQQRTSAAASLVLSLRQELSPLWIQLDRIQSRIETACPGSSRRSNLLVASALAAGVVLFLGSASCDSPPVEHTNGLGSGGTSAMDSGGSSGFGGSQLALGGNSSFDAGLDCAETQKQQMFNMAEQNCSMSVCDYGVVIDAQGNATDIVLEGGGTVPDEVRTCYLKALAQHPFPCLAGDTVMNQCVIVCLF